MRMFWSFIALLLLATAAMFIFPELVSGAKEIATNNATANSSDAETIATTPAPTPAVEVDEDPVATSDPVNEEPAPVEIEETTPVPVNPEVSEDAVANDADQDTPKEDDAATITDPPVETDTQLAEDDVAKMIAQQQLSELPKAVDAEDPTTTDDSKPRTPPWEEPAEAEAEADNNNDAAAPGLADDRFEVKGKGTKDDPYLVTWEMLTSAYETYRPKDDKTEIPEHIQMLDGKYVRISGYLAFPMLEGEVTEALVMLNQWDGCCLGVPPSPYDSIEVTLTSPIKAEVNAFTPFGAVTGKIKIDPYLVNGWLVGLYLMDGATVQTVM